MHGHEQEKKVILDSERAAIQAWLPSTSSGEGVAAEASSKSAVSSASSRDFRSPGRPKAPHPLGLGLEAGNPSKAQKMSKAEKLHLDQVRL